MRDASGSFISARVTTAARNYERESRGFSAAARISLRSGSALVCLTKRLNELPETRVSGKSGPKLTLTTVGQGTGGNGGGSRCGDRSQVTSELIASSAFRVAQFADITTCENVIASLWAPCTLLPGVEDTRARHVTSCNERSAADATIAAVFETTAGSQRINNSAELFCHLNQI